jgi:hypothetical protein
VADYFSAKFLKMINESRILELIDSQKATGLNITAFCANEGIPKSSYYYWRKKLNRGPANRFIPLLINSTAAIIFCANEIWSIRLDIGSFANDWLKYNCFWINQVVNLITEMKIRNQFEHIYLDVGSICVIMHIHNRSMPGSLFFNFADISLTYKTLRKSI